MVSHHWKGSPAKIFNSGSTMKDLSLKCAALRAALFACVLFAASVAHADDALYRDLGGQQGIAGVVDDFIVNVFADPRTQPYFAKASKKRLNAKLREQFCVLAGGPCKYTGSSMKSVHKNLKIDRAAFDATVEDLQDAMDKNHVPFHAQNRFLAKLAPMHREIETR